MVGILVVSHGKLAKALISSVQMLVGKLKKVKGISIWPKDDAGKIEELIEKGIEEVDDGDGVVILTDILGGTPTNLSLSVVEEKRVEVVTGVNLPMLLTLWSQRGQKPLREMGRLVKKSGRRSIILVKGIWHRKKGKKGYTKARAGVPLRSQPEGG